MVLKKSFAGSRAPCAERRINELGARSIGRRGICRTFSTASHGFRTVRDVQTKRPLRDMQFSVSFRVGDWTAGQLVQRMPRSTGPIVGQGGIGRLIAMDK